MEKNCRGRMCKFSMKCTGRKTERGENEKKEQGGRICRRNPGWMCISTDRLRKVGI